MKTDKVTQRMFQNEIDNQRFREPSPKEIAAALNLTRIVSKKKIWVSITLAAAVLCCLVFAFSFSYSINGMQPEVMQPLAKIITENLPENPEEKVFAFISSVQLGMNAER
ncbi:MAG: hypothetical protein LBV20_02325 [Treponema sp.]|jgi:hypothetical protein|nr:hypothetical protein [Treponema sp.]